MSIITDKDKDNKTQVKEKVFKGGRKEVSKIVKLRYSFDTNAFKIINFKTLPEIALPMGSSERATHTILSHPAMLESVMPRVINSNPGSKNSNWDEDLAYFFDSMHVDIPLEGKTLEIGFVYNINDKSRKEDIMSLAAEHNITSSEGLAKFVEGVNKKGEPNVEVYDKYMYGYPIDAKHFIIYAYTFDHQPVANSAKDIVSKSKNIMYWIEDPEEHAAKKRADSQLKGEAMKQFVKLLTDASKKEMVILAIRGTLEGMDEDVDKDNYLQEVITSDPGSLVEACNDKLLQHKSFVRLLIDKGLFTEMENKVIYETTDPTKVIGNNMKEAIAFMSNTNNDQYVNTLRLSIKTM